jgi:4a-hydroxytetrahydrobiopterin dehydratase
MTTSSLQQLAGRKCEPCKSDIPPMQPAEVVDWLLYVPGWDQTDDYTRIIRDYRFKDFASALAFVNAIGAAAEKSDHHPDVCLGWGYVKVTWTTHKIKGLSENDFIMAARTDLIAEGVPGIRIS